MSRATLDDQVASLERRFLPMTEDIDLALSRYLLTHGESIVLLTLLLRGALMATPAQMEPGLRGAIRLALEDVKWLPAVAAMCGATTRH